MKIYSTIYDSPVGSLHIQCTDAAVCAILFTNENQQTSDEHPLINDCISQLQEYFEGKRTAFTFPIQQSGTLFQQKVWTLLSNIPFGKTLSYKTVAQQFGDLKAIRAIATANGQNKLSIVIPCHRVIGSDGSLTGYAGGLGKKQWLLQHEAKWHSGVQHLF